MVKKVRCPHCNEVNTFDTGEVLSQSKQVVFKKLQPIDIKQSSSNQPETVAVTCHNCKQQFKIKV